VRLIDIFGSWHPLFVFGGDFMRKREAQFQKELIKEIKERMPNCIVLKNDPNYIQGIPDLLILNGPTWGALEVKRGINAVHQPNQDYYINRMNGMSFASFIFPENKDFILDRLQHYLTKEDAGNVSMGRFISTEKIG
jgi:hypothetical protein